MNNSRKFLPSRILFGAVLLMLAFCSALYGQSERARIIGAVTDPQGAVVPGASVAVINVATGVAVQTTTDQQGQYQAPELPIGSYKVKVERQGFKTTETVAYKLEINQTLKVDVRLPVGTISEVVEIADTAATVDTITPTMGSTVPEMEIHNAPLNGRNALDLALLQPGVVPADNPGNGGTASANTAFSISGGRNDSNTFVLDGGLNNDLLDNGVVYNPNPDAIQEFKVLTSNFSAEYGRNAGGIVTVVTKSGTNDFHGTAFEYNRNDAYNANTYINNSLGQPRPVLKRNQYGGTLGGPILKKKLFFFVSYQGQRQSAITPTSATTFTPAELQGNFSASPNQASVAAFLQANPFFQSNPALAAQGIIDPTKFDPVAQSYIKAGLVPTSPLASGLTAFQNPATDNPQEITAKFDWELTNNDRLSVTLGRNQDPNSSGLAATPSQFIDTNNVHSQFLNFSYVRTISSNMLNEFRVTAQRANIQQAVPASNLGTPQSFGTTVTPDNPVAPPLITFPNMSLGFSPQGPTRLTDNTFIYSDTFSWTHGRHNWKFGGSFAAFQNNTLFDFFVNGNFDFVPSVGAGDAFANFLLGVPDFLFQAPAAPSNIRSKATYVFGQDEWRVANNLVLTAGLRYEYSTPKSDSLGRSFSVVPGAQSTVFPNAPLGILFPGDAGAPAGSNFPDKKNFAPRFGFAWQPFHDGKTSIRGGFGVFYDVLKGEDNLQFNGQFPFAATAFIGFPDPSNPPTGVTLTAPFGFVTDPFGSTGSTNPFPSKPINHNISFLNNVGTFGGAGVFFVDPHLRTPYTYQYNLSIENEVARKMTFTVAYVGSSSHGLTGLKDVNPFDPTSLSNPVPQRLLNETPGNLTADPTNFFDGSIGFLPQFMNIANANYNALQLSLRQQQASVPVLGTMYYTVGYTWAHSLDDASGFRNNTAQVPAFQTHLFYASSDYDVRQTLTFSGGWDLPFNKGPKRLVKGWSLYPILSARTGFPFSVTDGLNTTNGNPGPSGAGDAGLVNANLVSPIQYVNSHSTGQFFNPASFVAAPGNVITGSYGTAGRNAFRGPGRTNLDLSLAKATPLTERVSLRLSVDAFNIFNHTQFRSLDTNVADATLGQVLSTYAPRELQLAAHIAF